ncbi:blue copper protein [Brachypodium distachyon]|uniref:Phytocyanin domain-containing protein n=1 Tax=Brachypodium distachyon TaxID=15368 RepID=I1H7G7_BRADI|nr:blue copper protein [Brachypodium distachyon]KQK22579.1 hypothetical protein BRADI_1g68150v3 [Brachypodium distachyon]|eukprot:XP_003558373.1 blue copper protein [Brachypodium distachyon]
MAQVHAALALYILLVHAVAWHAQAASYNVGNSAGWDISADLPSWADGKKFNIGDVLVFQYSKYHTLDEVDAAGFKNCSAANAVFSSSDGNTTVPLTANGDRYFICGNQMHCLGGMKLQVHVGPPGSGAGGAPADGPQASPGAALGPAAGTGSTDDAGIPTLVLGGSHRHRLGAGAVLLATWWMCVALLL